ncbi:MAG: outer membrane lipid asymmetry maintenance protein MlaD [Deltaproteobacteria bacterium]|nr:outer membrane lipid asymmetry maintenance protein MlaD [Deltaproteobacteria bacterium]
MKKKRIEFIVGLFIIAGFICIGYLTVRLGKMELWGGDYYKIYGKFGSVSGLKAGALIEMAGVRIGKVDTIELDDDTYAALVGMKIDNKVELTEDVIASVKTAGIIGDKYIKISQGGSDIQLKNEEMITETESALDIEELISKYAFGEL